MKQLLVALILILSLAVQLQAAPVIPWQEPTAQYRLELTTEHPENCMGFPLGRHLLPASLEQGLAVYDGKGNKLGYSFTPENGFLLIAAAPTNSDRLVYFGFSQKHPQQNWQKKDGILPQGLTLAMEVIRTRIDYPAVIERFKKRQKEPDANAFLGYFTYRHRRVDIIPTEKVRLDTVPKRYNRFTGITFTGMLKIDRRSDWDLRLECNSGALLEIDGRVLSFWFGESREKEKIVRQSTIRLEAGSHLLRLYYQYNGGSPFLNLEWKPKDETDFRPLTSNMFHPGWPGEVSSLRNLEGQRFPMIKREWVRSLYVNKTEKLSWQRFLLPENCTGAEWQVDGTGVASGNAADLLLSNPEKQLVKVTPGNGWTSFTTTIGKDYQEEKITYPQLYLKNYSPLMFFDDEESEITIEVDSGLPTTVKAELELSPNQPNPIWQNKTELLKLGQARSGNDDFAPTDTWKKTYRLLPQEWNAPLQLDMKLKMGGYLFQQHRIRLVPLNRLTDVAGGDDWFVDARGAQVIPILHRPTMAERRTWTLPRRVGEALLAPEHILLFADREDLNGLTKSSKAIQTVYWPDDESAQLKDLLQSFCRFRVELLRSRADGVVIMTPSLQRWAWLPPDVLNLLLAGLLETANANSSLGFVCLATPIPNGQTTAAVEQRWCNQIKKLARDYEIQLLDLNAQLLPIPETERRAVTENILKKQFGIPQN